MTYELQWEKYDWRTFEKICSEYIKSIYSAKFYEISLTQATKDSGRDIVIKKRNGNYEAWGECKHHNRNIDLSAIGKNVVLALSHQINKVIFFSVTKITPNTKIEIMTVAQKNDFEVLFLDGQELNQEILNCKEVAKKYFRDEYEYYVVQNKNNVWADVLISEYPFAEDARNNTKKQYHLENSFQIFFHLFIKNMNLCRISNISVKLINIPSSDVEFFEEEHQCLNGLDSYSDWFHTFHGVVFSPKKNIPMPDVVIKYTFLNGNICEEKVPAGTLDASDVWKAPYINTKTNWLLKKVSDILKKTVPQNYARGFYLYGRSGMGKSRLMNEIELKAYENGYRVIRVDFRAMEEVHALKSFLMALLGIPLSKSKPSLEYSDFWKIYSRKLAASDIDVLFNFIYTDNNKYKGLANSIINLLLMETEKDKILLSMDNIQEMSPNIQNVFWNIIEEFRKISLPLCFVFVNNTERQKSKKNVLVQYLQSIGEQYENFIITHHCNELEEDNAIIIMQQLLHLSSESDTFVKKLLTKIELCPMDILLLAKTLEQTPDLFQTINGKRYIKNTNSFSLDKYELPKQFDSVVNLRMKNLLSSVHNQEKYNQLFDLIAFLEGALRMDIFNQCAFDVDMLKTAKQNLIITVDAIYNTIHFYHEKIYKFIKKNYCGLAANIIETLYKYFLNKENKSIEDYYFFIKVLIVQEKIDEAVDLGLKILEKYKESVHGRLVNKICNILQKVTSLSKYPKEYFTVIFLKADLLLERINISEAEELFEEAKKIIVMNFSLFSSGDVIHFFHRYINQKLHTLQYEKAFTTFAEFEDLIGNNELNSSTSMIINDRRCVALYSLGRETEALEAISNVLETAKREINSMWLSIAYSDRAFCHFYNSKNTGQICADFSKAIEYYENGDKYDDISREIEIQIQKTIVNILKNDYKKAELEINKSMQIAEEAEYGYLLGAIYNIQAYIMILKKHPKAAKNILKKALEYASTFSDSKKMVSIYNNLGCVYIADGKHQEAFNYFKAGLKILKEICKPQNSFRYMGFLGNIVKLSIILDDAQFVMEHIDIYRFDALTTYRNRCQKTFSEKGDLTSFSYGVLSYQGYDYLY